MDQKADVLIKYFRESKSQRAVAREMKLSRTTIIKYINDYESKSEEIEEIAENRLSPYTLKEAFS